MKNTDVHTEHCCIVHGCKYGDDSTTCSVTTGRKKQSFMCENCTEEGFTEIPTLSRKMNDDDFDLLREIVNKARFGQTYKHLLPEMKKRFDASPEFKRVVRESLGHAADYEG